MTEHERYERMLGAGADLTVGEEAALRAHLETCPSCRSLANEYARQDVFLRALRFPQPARSIRAGVLARARQPVATRRRYGFLALAPAAVIVALVALQLRGHGSSRAPTAAPIFGPVQNWYPARAGSYGHQRSAKYYSPFDSPTPSATSQPASPLIDSNATLARSHAGQDSLRVQTVSDGVVLSLFAARRSYPRNAIVPIHIRVSNRSKRVVQVLASPPESCGSSVPYVTAVTARGVPLSPLPVAPQPNCPLSNPEARAAVGVGQSISAQQYVVLTSPQIRLETDLVRSRGCTGRFQPSCQGDVTHVEGNLARFRLTRAMPPRIRLVGSPPSALALQPIPTGQSSLWYKGWETCQTRSGQLQTVWLSSSVPHDERVPLLPSCDPHHISLHVAAGWVGGPAAVINLMRGMSA